MIMGSVAATDTTSNDTIELQSSSDYVDNSTINSVNSVNTIKANDSTNTNSITKVSNTNSTNKSVKSSSSSANTLTVKQSSTNIKVYNVTSTRNSNVTFKSVITTNTGAYVKNGTVVYKINGKTIGNTTVSNGGAKLTYTIPSNWGNLNYTITAVYVANDYYSRSTSNSTLKLKSNYTTTVTVNDISASAGDTVVLKAVIKTTTGSYAKTGKVSFKINGKTIGTTYVSNGGAKITYTIPSNWKSSNYTISVVYGQNDYYKSSTGTGTLKILTKATKISMNSTSITAGKSTTLMAVITDGSGNKVTDGKVSFKVNGKTIGTVKVSNGIAKLTYTIPSNWNGKYNMSAVYGASSKYSSSSKTTTLNVINTVSTKITVNTTSVTAGQSAYIIATITDGSGNKVNGGKVSFKLNGKTIGTVNVTSIGVAKLNYNFSSKLSGKYNLSIVYSGSGKYLSSRKNTTLTVNKQTSSVSTSNLSGYASYLQKTTNCDVNNSKIKSLVSSLTSGISDTYTKAVKIYNYVRDSISYSSYLNTKSGSVGTLTKKTGNCVDQTHLLIAMLRTANIPARYCHATCTFRSGLVIGHVWAEVYVNGKWYSADTTSTSNSFGKIVNWSKSTTVKRYTSLSF